jgi:hypothetical protein
MMDRILFGLPWCFMYLDDVIVFSRTAAEHRAHLLQLFQILQEAGLVINRDKCVFGKSAVDFLGHRVLAAGSQPLCSHVEAIQEHPGSLCVKDLQGFLGVVNFYRRFVPAAAHIILPLTEAMKGNPSGKAEISWSPDMEVAFQAAKAAVCSAALLAHPKDDAEIALMVDASSHHVGASLQQRQSVDGPWQPLGFYSRKLEPAQTRYTAFDRELWACFSGIRHLLEGRRFTIFTDHKPLTFALRRTSDPWTPRQCRQLSYIAEFTSDLRHVAGADNVIVDTLSRPPAAPLGPSVLTTSLPA